MGLDMYLERDTYIGEHYEHRNLRTSLVINKIDGGGKRTRISHHIGKIASVTEQVGYWRKANQIHNWFVTHVQDGKDDCERYCVSREELQALLSACKEAIKDNNPNILPPRAGFFFGSTDISDYYWDDIRDTIRIIEPLLTPPDTNNLGISYYYQSSW